MVIISTCDRELSSKDRQREIIFNCIHVLKNFLALPGQDPTRKARGSGIGYCPIAWEEIWPQVRLRGVWQSSNQYIYIYIYHIYIHILKNYYVFVAPQIIFYSFTDPPINIWLIQIVTWQELGSVKNKQITRKLSSRAFQNCAQHTFKVSNKILNFEDVLCLRNKFVTPSYHSNIITSL